MNLGVLTLIFLILFIIAINCDSIVKEVELVKNFLGIADFAAKVHVNHAGITKVVKRSMLPLAFYNRHTQPCHFALLHACAARGNNLLNMGLQSTQANSMHGGQKVHVDIL